MVGVVDEDEHIHVSKRARLIRLICIAVGAVIYAVARPASDQERLEDALGEVESAFWDLIRAFLTEQTSQR